MVSKKECETRCKTFEMQMHYRQREYSYRTADDIQQVGTVENHGNQSQ